MRRPPRGSALCAHRTVQQSLGCTARIGFTLVDSLDDVTADAIAGAPLLYDHFLPDEWGSCNQLAELPNGLIEAIVHRSWGEMVEVEPGLGREHVLHYYSMAFALDPETRGMTPPGSSAAATASRRDRGRPRGCRT